LDEAGVYLVEGMSAGGVAIVIATPGHVTGLVDRLASAGFEPAAARGGGQLIICDAHETLSRFMVDGHPDGERFDAVVGELCRSAARAGGPTRAFGEMVSVLWDAGQVNAAIEVEELWNDLGTRAAFSLYCAYDMASVQRAGDEGAVRQIVHQHSEVVGRPAVTRAADNHSDSVTCSFAVSLNAPGAARHFVTAMVEDDSLADDAALIVTELATNAVIHAHSPFSVTVQARESEVLIAVEDHDTSVPRPGELSVLAPSGRGLQIVASLSRRWGIERVAGGKSVWAVLEAGPASA
jgi:anti-sigma regulatory factor (Ser/Thr protein kinase)